MCFARSLLLPSAVPLYLFPSPSSSLSLSDGDDEHGKVRWLNDWLPAGDKAAIYLGVEQGLFAAEGIEVEIASARGGSDVVTKLATNSADFGSAGLASLLQAKAQGEVPVVAVAPIYNKQPDAFFTTEGSGIDSFKDIVGKTVATPTFSASNVVWPLLLERNGIDPASVKLLKLDPGALAPMLATGKVDATINWLTVAPGFVRALGEACNRASRMRYRAPQERTELFRTFDCCSCRRLLAPKHFSKKRSRYNVYHVFFLPTIYNYLDDVFSVLISSFC